LGIEPGPELQRVHRDILNHRDDYGDAAEGGDNDRAADVPPRQLPSAVRHFTGRTTELDALSDLATRASADNVTVIAAIDGSAGVGKTALAVSWAHRVADHFPDGQLYVNLRGFDPSGSAMTPADAIRAFLDALQVPPEQIPSTVDAQAALYRSLLADRRVLVVLDNARGAEQV